VIFGAESLAYKLFVGIGPVIAGLLIDFAGITPDMQPGEATQSIVVALGLGQGATMAVLLAISLTFLRKYDLTRERHRTIRRVLETRRADPGVLPN